MTDLRPLFDRKGKFVDWPQEEIDALDPTRQQLYADVRDAALACEAAESDVKACEARIRDAVAEVADAENFLKQNFPAPTHFDLWKQHFGRRPAENPPG